MISPNSFKITRRTKEDESCVEETVFLVKNLNSDKIPILTIGKDVRLNKTGIKEVDNFNQKLGEFIANWDFNDKIEECILIQSGDILGYCWNSGVETVYRVYGCENQQYGGSLLNISS